MASKGMKRTPPAVVSATPEPIVAEVAPAIEAAADAAAKTAEAVAEAPVAIAEATAPVIEATVKAVDKTVAPVAAAAAPAKPAPTPVQRVKAVAKRVVKAAVPVAKPVPAKKTAAKAKPVRVPTPKTPTKIAAPKVAATAQKEIKIMATSFETMTTKPTVMIGEMNERAKVAMEKSSKAFEDMTDFAKGNVEALVEAGRIATKGAEDIAKYSADYSRTAIEKANATAKQFAGVKSPTEFFQLQGDLTKAFMDTFVTEGSKFAESYMKLMGEVAQPISNRVAVAAEKVKIAA